MNRRSFDPEAKAVRRRIFATALLALVGGGMAGANADEWIKLQAPRFGVISQLGEEGTRRWAVEFDQFIDALHELNAVDELALPPLTIVLFDRPRDFAPYRNRTESGQANVSGFFANTGSWSVIGMAARTSTAVTRRIVYHEAVHWFASAAQTTTPMWYEEGLAEVFSTFEVDGAEGRWGTPIEDYVHYLRQFGLQPFDEFVRVSQDEALHGSGRFYPQAWAFVHYLLFANGGQERDGLSRYLRTAPGTDPDEAFTSAFGRSYEEMTSAVLGYMRGSRFSGASMPLTDRGREMTVEPAAPAAVEFALGRLAAAGGNDDLARRHAEAVLAMAPGAAPPHELLALLAHRASDRPAYVAALDAAIELGSQDASVYSLRGYALLEDASREGAPLENLLPADAARTAADLFGRAVALRPQSRDAYEGLAIALVNVDAVTEQDEQVLAIGRRALPRSGLVLVGQAAVARQRGDVEDAIVLLRQARSERYELAARLRPSITALHDAWLGDWLGQAAEPLFEDARFDEAVALVDRHLADPELPPQARRRLEAMKANFVVFERLAGAVQALGTDRAAEGRAALRELANDPNVDPGARRHARRLLDEAGE